VIVQDGNYEKALRKFKKKINDSGLLNDLRDREFYEKPTTARKRKKSAAKNRWQKELIKQALPKKQF
jgi:small subunit ribosomal protein S21